MVFERDDDRRCRWRWRAAAGSGRSRRCRSSRFCVGACTTRGGAGERDDADARVARLLGDELLGGVLRRGQAVGLDVGGAHAARHVHREDDGLVLRRQRDHRLPAARRATIISGEREQEQRRRHVAAEALARAHRLAHHRQARVAQRELLLAPQDRTVGRDQQRHQPAAARAFPARGRSSQLPRRCAQACAQLRLPRRRRAGCGACAGRRSAGSRRPGRRRSRARARRRRRRGTRRAARPRAAAASSAKRLRKPRSCVSTKSCSPVSASWTTSSPRSGSSISSGSYSRTATTSWRCASCASGCAQPGALMKSETTNTSERRGDHRYARRAAARSRSVGRLRCGRRARDASCAGCAARGGGRCAPGSPCRRRRRRAARRRGCRGA